MITILNMTLNMVLGMGKTTIKLQCIIKTRICLAQAKAQVAKIQIVQTQIVKALRCFV